MSTHEPGSTSGGETSRVKNREVQYLISRDFVSLLGQLSTTLLISTYQAGKLAVIGTHQNELVLSFHNFEQAMGIAVSPRKLAIGSKSTVWLARNTPDIAPQIDPPGRYDGCYLTRSGIVTGEVHGHEMAWCGEELWQVNTLFSCLTSIDDQFSFTPRWRPPFISNLAAEDRCHLNGMAVVEGRPRFVTMMAESDKAAGWRPNKATTGLIMEVPTGRVVARGFAMPHSPRVHQGQLFALDSGKGQVIAVDSQSGQVGVVAALPGYTRGLAFHGAYAFVGLSRIRETATFGGVPIAERRDELKCGVGILHLPTGKLAAHFEFVTGVEEIFDVQVIPNHRCAAFRGPTSEHDQLPTIWSVPMSAKQPADQSGPTRTPPLTPWKSS